MFVKKYWRYSLILIPAVVILVLKIIIVIKQKNSTVNQPNVLKDEITNIKDKLEEVNTIVKVESAIAKEKNDQKMNELKEVQKISDDKERRKRLAQMLG